MSNYIYPNFIGGGGVGGEGGDLTIPLTSTDNWELNDIVGGTAAIDTGSQLIDFQIPALSLANSGGEGFYDLTQVINPYYSPNIEVGAQLSLYQNGDADSRATIQLRSASAGAPYFILSVWGNGVLESGWTDGAGVFTSYGWSSASLVPTNGTAWLRLRCRGSVFEAGWAIGSPGDPRPNTFNVLSSKVNAFRLQGEAPFTNVGFSGTQIVSSASNIRVQFSNIWVGVI